MKKYNLIQKFRGVENMTIRYNQPVDFMESGLMKKDKWDYWHIDVPFVLNTRFSYENGVLKIHGKGFATFIANKNI